MTTLSTNECDEGNPFVQNLGLHAKLYEGDTCNITPSQPIKGQTICTTLSIF